MAALFEHPRINQDWAKWAQTAPERQCKHCGRAFRPNHPRRQSCGLADCSGAKRPEPPAPGDRRRGGRDTGVQGLMADVVVILNGPDGPDGSRDDVKAAMLDLAREEASGKPSKAAYARVIAACSARMLHVVDG